MNTKELSNSILEHFSFLSNIHGFSITKNENHWLGGVLIEYTSNQYIISILYDKRENWFVMKLYSITNPNKTHFYIVQELGKICPLSQSPIIRMDNDLNIETFLTEISKCLKEHFNTVKDLFNTGNYYGG